jgi:hypothetical protein
MFGAIEFFNAATKAKFRQSTLTVFENVRRVVGARR